MTVQYNPQLLNRYIAPGVSDFRACVIPDLRPTHPESRHWLTNHFLNNVYRDAFTGRTRKYIINLLARAHAQFSHYHSARDATLDYLSNSSEHAPAVSLYFPAVLEWESCFLAYQVFVDLIFKMTGKEVFQPGSGTEEQRAYDIGNGIKHWAKHIRADATDSDGTLPLWLSNEGFHTVDQFLTYSELADITNEVAKTANDIQDVRSFRSA